jgi:hypothetical protein
MCRGDQRKAIILAEWVSSDDWAAQTRVRMWSMTNYTPLKTAQPTADDPNDPKPLNH